MVLHYSHRLTLLTTFKIIILCACYVALTPKVYTYLHLLYNYNYAHTKVENKRLIVNKYCLFSEHHIIL